MAYPKKREIKIELMAMLTKAMTVSAILHVRSTSACPRRRAQAQMMPTRSKRMLTVMSALCVASPKSNSPPSKGEQSIWSPLLALLTN